MTHLLDTNAWLRLVAKPEELNSETHALLGRPGILPFALSAISVWEITLKARKRRLDLLPTLDRWLQSSLNSRLVTVIPVNAEIATLSNSLPEPFHDDPADRLITATAKSRDLIVITSDEKTLRYSHVQSFDTR